MSVANTPATRLPYQIVLAALAAGLLFDLLLRERPWGVNFGIWSVAVLVMFLTLAHRNGVSLALPQRSALAILFLFSLLVAWRDSPTLKSIDFVIIVACLALLILQRSGVDPLRAGLTHYAIAGFLAGMHAFVAPLVLLFSDVQWRQLSPSGRRGHAWAVVRGIVIALPLLLLFGALLVAADALFERLVEETLDINLAGTFRHLLWIVLAAWIVAGLLRGSLYQSLVRLQPGAKAPFLSLGFIETVTVLVLLNLLFLSFVAVQFGYLFGGASFVRDTARLTLAEYARRGFFELVTVAMLVIPLLLALDYVARRESPREFRLFRLLTGSLVVLLGVIIISALDRMRLYRTEFGITELRLYTTAFMMWLGAVVLWFLLTVLRGKRERFMSGAFALACVAAILLHAANPDEKIVRINVERVRERPLDSRYLTTLSWDAVPELLRSLPSLHPGDRNTLLVHLRIRSSSTSDWDWRTWSVARWQGAKALGGHPWTSPSAAHPSVRPQ